MTENYEADSVDEFVDEVIDENDIVLFMKGTPKMPQCGFSERALLLLSKYSDNIKTVDVLENLEEFRDALEENSNRRTIPQTFVDGEFIGGSDILKQLDDRGELQKRLETEDSPA